MAILKVLFIIILVGVACGFKVIHPPELVGHYNSPWLRSYPVNISAVSRSQGEPLILRMTGSFAPTGPYEGTILLGCIEDETGSTETIIRRGLGNYPGISGWLNCAISSSVPGSIDYSFDGSDRSDITIPVWDSALNDIRPIRDFLASNATNRTVIIEIGWDDPNEWSQVYDSGMAIVFTVIVGGYAFAVTGVAIHKLFTFIRAFGAQKSLPQIVLWIELFANLERGIYAVVDPFFSRRIFSNVPQNILLTISWPVISITSLLITLYWKELLSTNQTRVITFLSKMKIPFIVIVVLQFSLELITEFLRGFLIGPVAVISIISAALNLISSLLTSAFFLHYGRKIIAALSNKNTERITKDKSKFQAVRRLMVSAGFELGYCALLVIPFTPLYFLPWPFIAFSLVFFLLMITISLIKILAFVSPVRKTMSMETPMKTSGIAVKDAAPLVTMSQ